MFYHLSPKSFEKFESSTRFNKNSIPAIFITPQMEMIKYFGIYLKKDFYYLYKVYLDTANIFDPRDDIDQQKMYDYINNYPTFLKEYNNNAKKSKNGIVETSLYNLLKDLISLCSWQIIENPTITYMIKELNYDGYISHEHGSANVAVFNSDSLLIQNSKKVSFEELEAIKTQDKIDEPHVLTEKELKDLQQFSNDKTYEKNKLYVIDIMGDEIRTYPFKKDKYVIKELLQRIKKQVNPMELDYFILNGKQYNSIKELEEAIS
jgi:hypothetical protein